MNLIKRTETKPEYQEIIYKIISLCNDFYNRTI
jgi:hypothetical protein